MPFNTYPILEQSVLTGAIGAGAVFWQLRNTSASKRLGLSRLEVSLGNAAVSQFSLYKTLTLGTQTGPLTGVSVGVGTPASIGAVAITWSAAPTVTAANSIRTALFPTGTAGFSPTNPDLVVWNWGDDDPLVIPVSSSVASSVVLVNSAAAGGVYFIDARWVEM